MQTTCGTSPVQNALFMGAWQFSVSRKSLIRGRIFISQLHGPLSSIDSFGPTRSWPLYPSHYFRVRSWQDLLLVRARCNIAVHVGTGTSKWLQRLLRFSGIHDRVVGWGIMLQAVRSGVRLKMRTMDFSIDLILPATLWPWIRPSF
jgi:hypothetical protein